MLDITTIAVPQSPDLQPIVESIDKDIQTHNNKAAEFLSTVYSVLLIAIGFALLYVVPGMADRALPKAEKVLASERAVYDKRVSEFKSKYSRSLYPVSTKAIEAAEERGSVTQEMRDAHALSNGPSATWVQLLGLASSLKIEDAKMEYLGGTCRIPKTARISCDLRQKN